MSPERRRDILRISLPILGGMTSQNLLNLVDAWMVGSLGATALAAVGLAGFLNFMAVAALAGFSSAVQALVARRAGAGEVTTLAEPLNGALLLSLMLGVPLAVLGIAAAPALFAALNPDPAVAAEGTRFGVNGVDIGLFCSTPMVALTRAIPPKASGIPYVKER